MTTLPLLTPARSGVYRAPLHVDTVRQSAGEGALWLDFDLTGVRAKDELLETFSTTCGFPATFGRNWDALADALQDMSCCPATGYVLHLRHAGQAAQTLGVDWATLLDVLFECAGYWKAHEKPFIVFVDGSAELSPWI